MQDYLFVEQLRLNTVIGVLPHEKLKSQPLIVDIKVGFDLAKSGLTDDLNDTISYVDVVDTLKEVAATQQFELVERFAYFTAQKLHQTLAIQWVQMKITKPLAIEGVEQVGIVIEQNFQ